MNTLRLLLGLSFVLLLFSCNGRTDSAGTSNKSGKDSINTVADSVYAVGRAYVKDSGNYGKGIEYYQKALNLYEQTDNKEVIAKTNKMIGFAYGSMEDYRNEEPYLKKALAGYIETDNKKEAAIVMNFLGILYTITSKHDSAIHYFNKGLDYSFITRDSIELIEIYQNLGLCYQDLGDYEKTVDSHLKGLKIAEDIHYKHGMFLGYLNLAQDYKTSGNDEMFFKYIEKTNDLVDSATVYYDAAAFYHTYAEAFLKKKDFKKARDYFLKTFNISKKNDYKRGMAASASELALLELKKKNYAEAEKFAVLSINLEESIDNFYGMILSMLAIAQINYEQNQYAQAFEQLKKAEKLSAEKNILTTRPDIHYHYYQLFKGKRDLQSALLHFEKYNQLNDSLKGVELNEKIAALELKYQTEKKQRQYELLNIENENKQQKLKNHELLIILLVLFIVIIIGIGFIFRQKGMQNLNKMESELHKYLLRIKDMENTAEGKKTDAAPSNLISHLTEREKEIFFLMSEGKSNAEIAEKIFVSQNTIKYHIKNIYIKLDVKNRIEALNVLKN